MKYATPSRRDSQRQKLYDAEDVLRLHEQKKWVTVPEMQAYVDKLLDSAWFKRKWPNKAGSIRTYLAGDGRFFDPRKTLIIHSGAGNRRATYGQGVIKMPKWARREHVLLHEVAHYVTPQRPAHGWQFAQNLILLVQHQMGREAADALRLSFRTNKVKYTKPRPKRPMTEEQKQVLRERLVKARAAKGRHGTE